MLLVDERVGSGELTKYLMHLGADVEVTKLPFGDMEFLGNGPEGKPIFVGIERKTVQDFLGSVWSGRFHGHQLPGMIARYDHAWLILEGLWRPSAIGGIVEVPQGKGWFPLAPAGKPVLYRELEGMLINLEMMTGMRIRKTTGKLETCKLINALYHWWQKPFEQHKSHLRFTEVAPDTALLSKPTLVRLWAKELPGIGWEKSQAIASAFSLPEQMVGASIKDWMKIPGVGKTLAERIYKEIHG